MLKPGLESSVIPPTMFLGKSSNRPMNQKGNTLDHDFYVAVGKQCCTENAYAGHQHNILI